MNYYKLLTLEEVSDILQIDIERVIQLVLTGELRSLDYEHVRLYDLLEYKRNGGI